MRAAAVSASVRTPRRRRPVAVRLAPQPVLRAATSADARAVHGLITAHQREGHLLPRTIEDVDAHVSRFIVAVSGTRIVACADLAPLSPLVAEVRSLVVD